MSPLDEDLCALPAADAALTQLRCHGWSAGDAVLA